ncbi:hypothetical protein [Natronococcus occultus]|uniref:PRC-barrel domain-containing protein n=1 Tax=Natronococcus occultus SP4 TaxID=694430 RepID=L0JVE5_9EURY|nr:hypothetical protein [Natronococcus occultus]AGB37002.1 hypothetical protein Natoc_1165 [Natronococcus occultus SP4]
MADDTTSDVRERRLTTDPERIREWAESRDAVPVSTHGGEGHGYSFARREELDADEDAADAWAAFDERLRDDELVVLYRDGQPTNEPGELGEFEVLEREGALKRASRERSELEDALRRGETVTTEVVESDVESESRVVERDTVESEVVDREIVDRELVESELLERAVVDTEFVGDDVVAVTADESRLETIAAVERYTVESEVVDVDIDRGEPRADSESVRRSVLEAVPRWEDTAESVDRELARSEDVDGDGDFVRNELLERRTVEERVEERIRRRFALEDTEVLDSEVLDSDVLEGELVDPEEYETVDSRAGDAETTATGEPVPGTEPIVRELDDDDVGKTVVDESDERIGIVTAVEGDTAYVDPEPGLADRLKAKLNWLERDDDRPVRRSRIGDITDDELVVRPEPEDA